MNKDNIIEIIKYMEQLPSSLQAEALEFVKDLNMKENISMTNLTKYVGCISPDDLKAMSEIIEKDCSKVDLNEW